MSNKLVDVGADFDLKLAPEDKSESLNAAPTTEPQRPIMKPKIPIEEIPVELRGKALSKAEIDNLAEVLLNKFSSDANAQLLPKKQIAVTDFSKLTEEDIYNNDIFIEAKPFMSGDPLNIPLKDKNYEPRWTYKGNQRLGYMLSLGYTYVEEADIEDNVAAAVHKDAEGHYSMHDVVYLKIPKAIYFPALKAAAQKAERVVNQAQASKTGAEQASRFMTTAKDDVSGVGQDATGAAIGGDFAAAQRSGQMKFYNPSANS